MSKKMQRHDPDCRENHRRYTTYIPTPDDFYPTFPDGTVRVSVALLTGLWGNPAIRMTVWGNDDTGYERDEFFTTNKEAHKIYEKRVREISNWAIITKGMLIDLGFHPA